MIGTYMYQHNVPQLPVPDLDQTIALYLKCLKPIVSSADYEKTEALATEFLKNEGPLLQQKLLEYSKSIYPESWLMPYSRDIYLDMRKPITIEGNYILELAPFTKAEDFDYLSFVSVFVFCTGAVFSELENKTLPPIKIKDTPLCMRQFEGSLRGAKIPHKGKDSFVINDYKDVHSFGVFYKNNFYIVRLINEDRTIIEPSAILTALTEIYEGNAGFKEVNFNTAAFCGSDGTAAIIETICGDSGNKKLIDEISRTMFNITLKDCASTDEDLNQKLYTDTTDLWPYNPFNAIIYKDKICCCNFEHTYYDALTNIYLLERITEKFVSMPSNINCEQTAATVTPVNFNLSDVEDKLKQVKNEYLDSTRLIDFYVFNKGHMPISKLKEQGINIDFYYQQAFIYAQLIAFGEAKSTHESVSATMYNDGRTSCVRTVSDESLTFIDALKNSGGGLIDLLKAAGKEHVSRVKAAKDFVCFIRHAAGLNIMYERFGKELGIYKKPELLTDSSFVKFCTQELSTSTVGNSRLVKIFAYSPQVEKGLGVAYNTHGDNFTVTLSYYKRDSEMLEMFVKGLSEYFDKMEKLLTEPVAVM